MSKKNERHAKSKRDWGTQPSRSAELAPVVSEQQQPDPLGPKGKGRKNTQDWCRGKEGKPHQPELVQRPRFYQVAVCEWISVWDNRESTFGIAWSCCHVKACAACGKVLVPHHTGTAYCPDYPGTREQRATASAKAAEAAARREAWLAKAKPPRYRKPVITGPQGYRRPKSSK